MPTAYLAFVGLSVVLAITPGPDSLLVLRYSVRRVRAGLATAVGCSIATVVWAALVGIGLAAIMAQSAELFRGLKIVGGLYLVFLGVQAIRHSTRRAPDDAGATRRAGISSAFLAGLLSTMTNPKVGLFFLAIVPQFLPTDASAFGVTMLLGLTVAVIGLLYLVILAGIAARATLWLRRPLVATRIERVSGTILALLGVGTATSALEIP
ncbi:MAG: LysE family translocator [Burkholderiaceae bacterium]|nr:LysE family translocator [Microbacteriaceae bacterium]